MQKASVILLLFGLFVTTKTLSAQVEICAGYEEIDITSFWLTSMEENAILLDVREIGEVESGIIPGAHVIDVEGGHFKKELMSRNWSFSQPIYVYCRTGRRSDQAVDSLMDMGFERVVWLNGGITEWKKANREIVDFKPN